MTLMLFANLVCQELSPDARIIVWYVGQRSCCTHTAKELRHSDTAKEFFVDEMNVLSKMTVFCKVVR